MPPPSITTLPLEILTAILLQVADPESLLRFILTCRTVHAAFSSSRSVSSRIIAAAYRRSIPTRFLPKALHHSYHLKRKNTKAGDIHRYLNYLRASSRWIGHNEDVLSRVYDRWEPVRQLSALFCKYDASLDPHDERDLIKADSAVYMLYIAANFISGIESSFSYTRGGVNVGSVAVLESDDERGSGRSRREEETKIVRYLPAQHKDLCLKLYAYLDRTVYRMVSESRSRAWWAEMGHMFGDWNSDAVVRALEVSEIVGFIDHFENHSGENSPLEPQEPRPAGASNMETVAGIGEGAPKDTPEGAEYLLLSLWIRDGLRRHVMPPRSAELVRPLKDALEMIGTPPQAAEV